MVSSNNHPNLVNATHSSSNIHIDPSQFQDYNHQQNSSVALQNNPADLPSRNKSRSGSRGKFNEEWDASQKGGSIVDTKLPNMVERSEIFPGAVVESMDKDDAIPTRSGTLKKNPSVKRDSSFKRNGSRRGSTAGSTKGLVTASKSDRPHNDLQSAFRSQVPFSGDPTEVLANRFSAWRKMLKDLITYFREIQSHYEHRSKALLKIANVVNNTQSQSGFLQHGGIDDALSMLRIYHKDSITAANRARDIENDVILALTGLRVDLSAKIKEIKSLSGDFKNSVEKEMAGTRRAVENLSEALRVSEHDQSSKLDPLLLRMAADRQVERQIDEENYLQQAYLNLEQSGRELEAIVVGEIQKSHNAYAGILKREAEEALELVTELKGGPISMAKDKEWNSFIRNDSNNFIDPALPMRHAEHIHYPGRDNELATEVRAGLLERKSKYLKSYTAGWYVLSPTYLHEFKSADKTQAPIMSLRLAEQKLGSHSDVAGSTSKFILKGKQTGGMHRGHTWIFRAESHDTMMAWYQAIKTLTESAPQERNAFVRQHARSVSGYSQRSKAGSISSDGALDEDEDDEPFSAADSQTVINVMAPEEKKIVRPQPGGRFPSDLQLNTIRSLQAPLSPSSASSEIKEQFHDKEVAAAAQMPGSGIGQHYGVVNSPTHAAELNQMVAEDGVNPYSAKAMDVQEIPAINENDKTRNASTDGRDLFASAAAGLGGLSLGATGAAAARQYEERQGEESEEHDTTSGQYAQETFPGAVPYSSEAIALQEQAAREAEAIATPGDDFNHSFPNNVQTGFNHQNAAAFHNANIAAYEAHSTAVDDTDMIEDGPQSPKTEPFPAFVSGDRSQGDLTDLPEATFSSTARTMSPNDVGHDSANPSFIPLEAEPTPNAQSRADPLESDAATRSIMHSDKEKLPSQSHSSSSKTQASNNDDASGLQGSGAMMTGDSTGDSQQRPATLESARQYESTNTISNLHVPGEFPKEKSSKSTVSGDLPV